MAATAGNKLAGKFCGTDHRRALRKEPKVLAGKLDSINLIESSGFRIFGSKMRNPIPLRIGSRIFGWKLRNPGATPGLGKGPPLANTEIVIFINDFIMKSMLFATLEFE